jgi:hypothetical protein
MIGDPNPTPPRASDDRFGPFADEAWIVLNAARGIAQLESLLAACAVLDDRSRDLPRRSEGPPAE